MTWIITGPVYPLRGGIAHFTTALVRAAETRFDVRTMSFSRLYPRFLFPGSSTQDPSETPQKIDPWILVDSINPINWWNSAKKVRELQPDLVVFQWWTTFLGPCFGLMAYWFKKWGIPVVFLIHNVLPHEPSLFDRWIARAVLGNASGYVLLSEQEHQHLISILPQAAGRSTVHPHPVYEHIPRAEISKEQARHKLDLPVSKFILLFFGFVRQYKGILPLMESLASLKKLGKSVFLVVAGEIWHDLALYNAEIDRLDIRDCLRFDNRYIPDEEVPIYFAAADLFVAPYLRGTQSGSLKLALSQDIPLLVSQHLVEGLEALQNDRLLAVPAGDIPALTHAIASQLERDKSRDVVIHEPTKTETWDDLIQVIVNLKATFSKHT